MYTSHKPLTKTDSPVHITLFILTCVAGSVAGIAIGYGLKGPGIKTGGEIFLNHPDRPCSPPRLLYNGYRLSFPVEKRPRRGFDNTPLSSDEVKERVEL